MTMSKKTETKTKTKICRQKCQKELMKKKKTLLQISLLVTKKNQRINSLNRSGRRSTDFAEITSSLQRTSSPTPTAFLYSWENSKSIISYQSYQSFCLSIFVSICYRINTRLRLLKFPDSELLDEEDGGAATPTPGGDGVIFKEDVIAEWGADPQDVLVQSRN